MDTQEFSNGFDTLVNSYRRFKDFDKKEELDSIEFNEYEKSLYLTMAQEELAINLYNGRNPYGLAFEGTEEMRRYLDALVKTASPEEASDDPDVSDESPVAPTGVSANSSFYVLPTDIAFVVYEQVTYNDSSLGCYNGEVVAVCPVTHDEYNRLRKNPFRGVTKRRVLRLDAGEGIVELVSDYVFKDYLIRYLAKPEPIILEDFDDDLSINGKSEVAECALNPILHDAILQRAVQMALASKGIRVNNQ